MAKPTTIFRCSKCEAQFPKWQGRCTECGAWGTLAEETKVIRRQQSAGRSSSIETLATYQAETAASRLESRLREFDRVLGGGLVPGSVTLLGGDPGIGKSTLLLQVGGKLAAAGTTVLYVSGEESSAQVKIRFERLGLTTSNLKFLGETDVDTIIATLTEHSPGLVVLDSIQTMRCADVSSDPGSVGQVRAATAKLVQSAKESRIPIIVIGHVTKQGSVAGPRTLEHLVDVVLYLEGDRYHAFRVLRAVKNRFGSTGEVGVFDMQRGGLREVPNPSEIFLTDRKAANPGSVVTSVVEGSRAFLVEIQALVSRTNFGYPQRRAAGFDFNRLQLLIAVLMKKAGLYLSNQDIHVNVAGGIKVSEPAVDLAVCVAIASALKNKPVSRQMAVFGEIGLGGELRAVGQAEKRIEEIIKMGFKEVLMPRTRMGVQPKGIELMSYDTLSEALRDIL
ncbi:MAG: DNA repair protein RadA [Patescibacteria group bacterium]|nr:DNA repair protein RadA [Patescibacteria group bacterium]MDD5715461.1 DNA repair protein RadA [Patescibacteria group bacterium]